MAIRIKAQKDYFRTDVTVDLPVEVSEVDQVLRAIKTSGKMVVLYNNGFIQGINVEQNTKINENQSTEIRKLLAIGDEKV